MTTSHNEDDRALEEEMTRMGEMARAIGTERITLEAPPAELWSRIEDAIVNSTTEAASPVSIAKGFPRGRMMTRAIAIAAAITLVAAGVTTAVRLLQEDQKVVREVALSNKGLDPRGVQSTGEATLVRLEDGDFAIKLDLSKLPKQPDSDYYELWAIDTKVKGMVSLGPLHGAGTYRLPKGVDPTRFPIVDISIEPADGVPTHSGTSLLRGRLT